ncbi:hypothetical protein ACLKA7_011872 [Drosophila subpalustris]
MSMEQALAMALRHCNIHLMATRSTFNQAPVRIQNLEPKFNNIVVAFEIASRQLSRLQFQKYSLPQQIQNLPLPLPNDA